MFTIEEIAKQIIQVGVSEEDAMRLAEITIYENHGVRTLEQRSKEDKAAIQRACQRIREFNQSRGQK